MSPPNVRFRVKKDWRGAIYTLINPLAVPQEHFVYDGQMTLDEYVRRFVMDRVTAASMVMQDNTMFELLSPFNISRYDNNFNFLVIAEPIAWAPFWKWTRITAAIIAAVAVTAAVLAIVL